MDEPVASADAVFLDVAKESEFLELNEKVAELLASVGQDASGLAKLSRTGFRRLVCIRI